jgi:hypothetical protein
MTQAYGPSSALIASMAVFAGMWACLSMSGLAAALSFAAGAVTVLLSILLGAVFDG